MSSCGMRSLPSARSPCAGYLCRIVRNTALNVYDSMKRRSCEELYGELADVIPDTKTSDDHFDSAEIAGHLNEFLRNSKPKNRDIFTGRYYFNLSVREIADRMGMTETAVKTRLSRIRADLREYLVENGVSVD